MSCDATTPDIAKSGRAANVEKTPRRWVGWVVTGAWLANAAMLVGACLLLFFDGDLYKSLSGDLDQPRGIDGLFGGFFTGLRNGLEEGASAAQLQIVSIIVVVSMGVMFYGLIFGAPRQRRMRSWLALTALVAGWLMTLTAWETLAWAGQRWRVGRQVAEFESVASVLRDQWPSHDGAIDPLGPFSAYPDGRPQVLIPLTTPESRVGVAPFSVVEKSDAGGLRFELVGPEARSWMEWHPPDETPASFTGGLETSYDLVRWSALGDGWYLARYRVAPPLLAEATSP